MSDAPAVSDVVEDRPFGLQHRLGDLIWLWRYQVDVRACGVSVEQNIVQKFGFLIGRVLAPDRDNPLKRPNIEAGRLDLGLQVLQPVLEAFDLIQIGFLASFGESI